MPLDLVMKNIIIVLVVIAGLALFYFRDSLLGISKDVLQADLNPTLVSYLQGDWSSGSQNEMLFRIKRDSLIVLRNDSIQRANNLFYEFGEAASDYFTQDSSFVFAKKAKDGAMTEAFKLREVNNASKSVTVYTLINVSRKNLELMSPEGNIILTRVN